MLKLRATSALLTLLSLGCSASATGSVTCTFSSIAANSTLAKSCDIFCKPAKWTDVAVFYIGNYFAHVATVRSVPGQGALEGIFIIACCLLFPVSGLVPGAEAIFSLAIFANTPLQMAARAGALRMVVEGHDDEVTETRKAPDPERQETGDIDVDNSAEGVTPDQKNDSKEQGNYDLTGQSSRNSNACPDSDSQPVRDVCPGNPGNPPNTQSVELEIEIAKKDCKDNSPSDAELPQKVALVEEDSKVNYEAKKKNRGRLRPKQRYPYNFFPRTIHGRVSLPAGWMLVQVPPHAIFEDDELGKPSSLFRSSKPNVSTLSCDYSFIKAVIAAAQSLYAVSTLYNTSAYQIKQFGYAAFGFTVLPFAFMSVINLFANLICPEYSAVYIVENDAFRRLREQIVTEHKELTYFVDGTVGKLASIGERDSSARRDETYTNSVFFYAMLSIALYAIVIALMGGLTKFHKQDSTLAQRVWIMIWLLEGTSIGVSVGVISLARSTLLRHHDSSSKRLAFYAGELFLVLFFGAIAIGGYVIVGQMILQAGICESV